MHSPFHLDDVLIHPHARTLEVDGEIRQIDYKAMHVLICLAEQPNQVLTKQEIIAQVWSQDFVSDEVLTVAISRLRRALGDQARAPRFIETVPQVGYRLIAPVNQTELLKDEPEPVEHRSRKLFWGMILLLLLAIGWIAKFTMMRANRNSPGANASHISALAVLPLTNLTGQDELAHLAEGVTEALITGLAGEGNLRVVSRATVQRYRDERPNLLEIAQNLEVDAVLEGSVQLSGEHLRIAARLIDATGKNHLWADTFDGKLNELLDLQHQTVLAIRHHLAIEGKVEATRVPPEVHEAYLRGKYLLTPQAGSQHLRLAVQELETAVRLAPEYSPAQMALAEAWLTLGERSLVEPEIAFDNVHRIAQRLLEIGRDTPSAHALLAMVDFLYEWDFAAAERGFELAIQIDGENILARDGYSRYLTVFGRFDEALEQQRKLGELNPLIYHQPYLAFIFNMSRQHRHALDELHKQLQIAPKSAKLYSHLTSTYRWIGEPDQALPPFLTYLHLIQTPPGVIRKVESAFEESGIAATSQLILDHFHTLEVNGERVPAMSRAEVFAFMADAHAAMLELEQAFERREPALLLIAQSPDYDSLRAYPPFVELLRRIGLPERPSTFEF